MDNNGINELIFDIWGFDLKDSSRVQQIGRVTKKAALVTASSDLNLMR